MSKLLPGENLVLKEHPHWITLVGSLVVPVVLLVIVAIADFTILGPASSLYTPKLRTILSLIALAIALLWAIVVWIRWQSTTYTLTDQRIKIERGIFTRQEKIIAVDRVQDVSTKQGILGRILGYGMVQVESAGEVGAEIFASLPQPNRFRDEVFVQSEKRRGGAAPAAPSAAPLPANPSGI